MKTNYYYFKSLRSGYAWVICAKNAMHAWKKIIELGVVGRCPDVILCNSIFNKHKPKVIKL